MFSLRPTPDIFGRCSEQTKQMILHNDYDHKGSAAKNISLDMSISGLGAETN
jgi:hypothetical protein